MSKTAAVIITGNEILSGKVVDQNSPYLAAELRALGISLERIAVLPDDVDILAEEISIGHARFDILFITGGIGPTHDDVTLEALAKGMGRALHPHPVLCDRLKTHFHVENAVIKMASVPEGSELIYGDDLKTPILKIENIYVFPGVFEFFRKKFNVLKKQLAETPFHLTKVFFRTDEENIAKALYQTGEQCPQLRIGSYPALHQVDYKVVVTLESKDAEAVKQGIHTLLSQISNEWIWKVESVLPEKLL